MSLHVHTLFWITNESMHETASENIGNELWLWSVYNVKQDSRVLILLPRVLKSSYHNFTNFIAIDHAHFD